MNTQPDLRALTTFLTVVSHGSMTAAAEALGYVPSAVSQQISRLERSLGVGLFVRTAGSRVIPTQEGRSLARGVTQLFAATATFQDLAQQVSENVVTELRIGAYGTATSHLLPPVLAELRESQSGAAIHVTEVETAEGLPMVLSGQIDLLIAYRYLPEDPPTASEQLMLTRLGREPMLLLAAKPPGVRAPLLRECQQRDWVAGAIPAADGRLLHRWANGLDFVPKITFDTPDCHTAISLIAHGLVVGLIPATVAAAWPDPSLPLCKIDLPKRNRPFREVLAATRPGLRSVLVKNLIQRLTVALAEHEHLQRSGGDLRRISH